MPIKRKTILEIAHEIEKSPPGVNLCEIWLDQIKTFDESSLLKVIRAARVPVLCVCKTPGERGEFRGSEAQSIERLMSAIRAGAAYIDCSSDTEKKYRELLRKECKKYSASLILSTHIWELTPSIQKLLALAKSIARKGCNIVKIATQVRTYSDSVVLFELCMRLRAARIQYIVTGMGEKSTIARIGCALLGSRVAYVAASKNTMTAPGQLTVREWRRWMTAH